MSLAENLKTMREIRQDTPPDYRIFPNLYLTKEEAEVVAHALYFVVAEKIECDSTVKSATVYDKVDKYLKEVDPEGHS